MAVIIIILRGPHSLRPLFLIRAKHLTPDPTIMNSMGTYHWTSNGRFQWNSTEQVTILWNIPPAAAAFPYRGETLLARSHHHELHWQISLNIQWTIPVQFHWTNGNPLKNTTRCGRFSLTRKHIHTHIQTHVLPFTFKRLWVLPSTFKHMFELLLVSIATAVAKGTTRISTNCVSTNYGFCRFKYCAPCIEECVGTLGRSRFAQRPRIVRLCVEFPCCCAGPCIGVVLYIYIYIYIYTHIHTHTHVLLLLLLLLLWLSSWLLLLSMLL